MRFIGNSVGWTKKSKHLKVEKIFLEVLEICVKTRQISRPKQINMDLELNRCNVKGIEALELCSELSKMRKVKFHVLFWILNSGMTQTKTGTARRVSLRDFILAEQASKVKPRA